MRTIDISKATGSLAHYARRTRKGPMILTSKGRPVAALVSMNSLDLESFSLSTNPEFIAMIEQSRSRHRAQGGISSAEMRRRLGIRKTA